MVRLTAAMSSPTSAWNEARSALAGVGGPAVVVGVIGNGGSGYAPIISSKARCVRGRDRFGAAGPLYIPARKTYNARLAAIWGRAWDGAVECMR